MGLLTKSPETSGDRDMIGHTIGNTLVVRPKHVLRDEIRDLALGLAADPEHELVVVDLPVDSSFAVWESAAKLLPRKRRGVRLVISGRSRETTALAGQWLSERLNRTVVAPDGAVMRGLGGTLFVDSGWGTGWVRFQPGKPPVADGKRFPRPVWEGASPLVEIMPTSAGSVVEPLPGGVWLRPRGPESVLRLHRKRLVEALPAQPEVCTVVLGCPGSPPISVYDVIRFWGWLPPEVRGRLRLVKLGPLTLPGTAAYGQALADAVGEQVVCYTGIPVGSRLEPEIFTLRADGSLGWRNWAEEVTYTPSNGTTPVPMLSAHRNPIFGIEQVGPAAYRYAPGVVLEVVPSGLWLRPDRELPHAHAVRSALPDGDRHQVLFEDSHGDVIRELAADVFGSLEPATRQLSGVVRSDAVLRRRAEVGGPAMAAMDQASPTAIEAPESPTATLRHDALLPVALSPMTAGEADAMRPSWSVNVMGPASAGDLGTAPPPPLVSEAGTSSPALDVLTAAQVSPPASLVGGPGFPPGTPEWPSAGPQSPPPLPPMAAAAGLPVVRDVVPRTPTGGPLSPVGDVTAAAPPASTPGEEQRDPVAAHPGATPPPMPRSLVAPRPTEPQPVLPRPLREEVPAAAPAVSLPPAATFSSRVQPTPSTAAAALVPKRGLDEERGWIRSTLAREYAAVANSVSRIMSEHPGFQGAVERSTGVLTDAVAIRLYLSGEGHGLDSALRTGSVGPHVPFARCVVSGLSRLPSHRGAAVFATSPTEQEWELYRSRKFVTEWGFVNALSAPCDRQRAAGEVDVVVWSMTARRTKLLEPEQDPVTDRVLFVPGTSFKVLDLVERKNGERGRVLLRELAVGEIDSDGRVDENRASLDELALNSLRRSLDSWGENGSETRVPNAVMSRFGLLPGLVRLNEEGQ